MPIRHGDILAKRVSTWPSDTDIDADYGNRTLSCRSLGVLLVA